MEDSEHWQYFQSWTYRLTREANWLKTGTRLIIGRSDTNCFVTRTISFKNKITAMGYVIIRCLSINDNTCIYFLIFQGVHVSFVYACATVISDIERF